MAKRDGITSLRRCACELMMALARLMTPVRILMTRDDADERRREERCWKNNELTVFEVSKLRKLRVCGADSRTVCGSIESQDIERCC